MYFPGDCPTETEADGTIHTWNNNQKRSICKPHIDWLLSFCLDKYFCPCFSGQSMHITKSAIYKVGKHSPPSGGEMNLVDNNTFNHASHFKNCKIALFSESSNFLIYGFNIILNLSEDIIYILIYMLKILLGNLFPLVLFFFPFICLFLPSHGVLSLYVLWSLIVYSDLILSECVT